MNDTSGSRDSCTGSACPSFPALATSTPIPTGLDRRRYESKTIPLDILSCLASHRQQQKTFSGFPSALRLCALKVIIYPISSFMPGFYLFFLLPHGWKTQTETSRSPPSALGGCMPSRASPEPVILEHFYLHTCTHTDTKIIRTGTS